MNLEFPQYLENSQSNPLQKRRLSVVMLNMNPSLSVQVLQKPNFQVIMYAHYFSKPVTRTGKKTNLIFDYLKPLRIV